MKKEPTFFQKFLLVFVQKLVCFLPPSIVDSAAVLLGRLFIRFSPGHLKLMVSNLRKAFKEELPQKELENIALRSIQNLFRCALEFLRYPTYSDEDIKRIVTVDGLENLEAVLSTGKGAVIATAHFGCWEIMGVRLVQLAPLTVVSRDQNDSFINDFITEQRTGKGIKLVPRGTPVYELIAGCLKNNELVGLISDQNAGPKGLFVDFFDTKVSTFKGPGMFAIRTGCSVIPMFIVREGFEKHRLVIRPAVEIAKTGDVGKDIMAYTQAFTTIIEEFVRKYPDHWFWIHKRWKTLPPGVDEE